MFRPVSAELDFVALEEAELARWRTNDVFTRSMKHREGAEPWVFYEGPPTANGKPGLHHVWARVYKDLFCRYQTMQGRYVARRAGWDTHGPVSYTHLIHNPASSSSPGDWSHANSSPRTRSR